MEEKKEIEVKQDENINIQILERLDKILGLLSGAKDVLEQNDEEEEEEEEEKTEKEGEGEKLKLPKATAEETQSQHGATAPAGEKDEVKLHSRVEALEKEIANLKKSGYVVKYATPRPISSEVGRNEVNSIDDVMKKVDQGKIKSWFELARYQKEMDEKRKRIG